MRILHINVLDKKATYLSRDGDIVCGNSNYLIEFAFDAEWDGYHEKTARFIWNGKYQDVKFAGTACYAPIVTNTTELKVGVYAGELSTTTSATIPCNKSILCESSTQGGSIIINGGEGGGSGSDVPIPTPNDNGKVLTAEDCKVIWKEPTGGAVVPVPTGNDKGKVLTANANGKAEWKEPTGGNGVESVQSDYLQNDIGEPDYIQNRPFFEEHGTKNGSIVWDGTLGDSPRVIITDRVLVRVSDKTNKNAKQYSCTMQTSDGKAIDFTEQDVVALNEDCDALIVDELPVVLCAKKPTKVLYSSEAMTIREAGTYFMLKGAVYVERLDYTIPNYRYVKKIDAHKFLDFGVELLFDVIATLGTYSQDWAYGNVKQTLNLEAGETYTVELDGVSYVCVAKAPEGGGATYIGNMSALDKVFPDTGEPFMISDSVTSTLILAKKTGDHTVTVYKGGKTKFVQIPGECLVLTSPNGTKYRLTVSDDGTLSAALAE